jgi:uncharacterized membrane protein YphA (DoxX/SURF4 family)
LSSYEFSQILAQYGFDGLRFLAPPVIVFEVAAGLLLCLHIRLRQVSLLALCFVAVASLAYIYGYFFVNITDCGCFGHFSFLNLSPFFTCVRNLVLTGMLLCVFLKSDKLQKTTDKNEILTVTCVLCAVCFVAGYSYVERKNDFTQYIIMNTNVENSVLGEFRTFSRDTAYFVFVFSYSCQHCHNSVENLKQYERLGVADKMLAMSYAADSATMRKFNDIFKPDFPIGNYTTKQLFRLTNQFPVSYYVENNVIRMEIRGLLPNGYLLRQKLSKINGQ